MKTAKEVAESLTKQGNWINKIPNYQLQMLANAYLELLKKAEPQSERIPIGVNDRNGSPIHIGDTLEFDEKEWGGKCVFTIVMKDGEITGCGTPSDWSEYCVIVSEGVA